MSVDDVPDRPPTMIEAQAESRIADLLPEGYTALGFAVSIKALDRDANVCLLNRHTEELAPWEAAGMLLSALDDVRAGMQQRE